MRKLLSLGIVLSALSFTACTHYSMSEEECNAANWYQIGVNDASVGWAPTRLAAHTEACQQYGKAANTALYEKGWNVGVRQYCTPQIGYQAGLAGEGYHGLCPTDLKQAFSARFWEGRRIYDIRAEYRSLERSYNSKIDEISSNHEKLVTAKDEWERKRVVSEISDLEKEKERIARRMRVYEMKHAQDLAD